MCDAVWDASAQQWIASDTSDWFSKDHNLPVVVDSARYALISMQKDALHLKKPCCGGCASGHKCEDDKDHEH